MTRSSFRLMLFAGLFLASPASSALGATAETAMVTTYTVLVGFPLGDDAASAGSLLVPGTVIPVEGGSPPTGLAEDTDIVEESLAFARVVDKLWRTFRLDPSRQLQQGRYVKAVVAQGVDLPTPHGADVGVRAELLGLNEEVATFRVVFRQDEKVLADSTVNVKRGGRAVVGGMNGESAPYIFVVVEPDPPRSRPVPYDAQAGFTEPVKVVNTPPVYPRGAKEEGIQGIVLLSAALDTEGNPRDLRVLRAPDPRLGEAALAAARQWRWEPARAEDGRPIAVYFTLTFNFRLAE